MKSIEIPESVKSIGYWAFDNCTSLEEVIFKGKTMDQVKAMKYYPWDIKDESIIKCERDLNESNKKNHMNDNILECIDIDITDDMLANAKIAAYMANQEMETPSGKVKPYTPKSFPDKAVVVQFNYGTLPIQLYLDTKAKSWNSCFMKDGHVAKLTPEQLDAFFSTPFYAKLVNALSKKWPTSDP